MARTHRSVWSRLWFLLLASTLVVLLAILALTPAAGAQDAMVTVDVRTPSGQSNHQQAGPSVDDDNYVKWDVIADQGATVRIGLLLPAVQSGRE